MTGLILTLAIIVGVVAIVIALIRSEAKHAGYTLAIILCLAWFGVGCYSAITMGVYYSTHSSTHGELVEHDPYEDFNFYEYKITDFGLDQDDSGIYFYQKDYATSIEFDGTEGNYVMLMNNRPCENTKSEYGKLTADTTIHYDDVDGTYKCGIDLDFTFTFYSSHIILRINTNATQDTAGLLNEYVAINGLELRIIDEVYTGAPILSDKAS